MDDSSTGRTSLSLKVRDLSHKIDPTLQPVFVSKKLGQVLQRK